ncbi:hypothetical protein [Streptomyces sp. NPDC126499]|uniref:hypothetical protein n=1 Tax=Streptomyces sp. NPDC126499 TaxID=3155314 RepID=UPI003319962F
MGEWAVIAQYDAGENHRTRVVREVTGTREQARDALWKAALSYREPVREKRRRVYRLAGGDSYLVRVNGLMSETDTVLSLAELVHDSAAGPSAEGAAVPEGPPAGQ